MMGILARMRGLAARGSRESKTGSGDAVAAGLGTSILAVRSATVAPAGSAAIEAKDGAAWIVSVATLRCMVTPFAAAPEIGLRLDYCFDPSGDDSRFGLLLAGELDGSLSMLSIAAAIQDAVQGALQSGMLELPPCTTDEEWHAFRGGLNELVYTRFGLMVEDCLPVDLHPETDFAASLRATADAPGPVATAPVPTTPVPAKPAPDAQSWLHAEDIPAHARKSAALALGRDAAVEDSKAMRRLFLEIPALAAGIRALPGQEGDGTFMQLQAILRRLALAAVDINTMPALTLSAPGQRIRKDMQQLRALHALSAQAALDEAWALLAAMRAGLCQQKLDDADRIVSNLEFSLAQRRTAPAGEKP